MSVLVAVLICTQQRAGAQGSSAPSQPSQPSQAAAGAGQDAQGQPPTINFPAEGITLEEAVRITLANDPQIKIQEATTRLQQGVAEEQAGLFDYTFQGSFGFGHQVQDLTQDRIKNEQDKRDGLSQSFGPISNGITTTQNLIQLLDQARQGPLAAPVMTQLSSTSPQLAGTLASFDALIPGVSGAALSQLQASRNQFLTDALAQLNQGLTQQKVSFLNAQIALANLGNVPTQEYFDNGQLNLQVAKIFRNGLQIAPFFDGTYSGTNFRDKPHLAIFGGKGVEDLITYQSGANLTVPLGRNRGSRAIDAFEQSAIQDTDASRLLADHQRSAAALKTVLAYWDVRALMDSIVVANDAVRNYTALVASSNQLVNAGDLARSELARAQAAEARGRAQLADAERTLHQAKVTLATAMGVASSGDESTLPAARDVFPGMPAAAAVPADSAGLVAEALNRRLDLQAAQKHEAAGHTLEDGAETNLRPQVDLVGSSFFTALGESDIARAAKRWVGPSATLQINVSRPIGNNHFRGQLVQREADTSQRNITSVDLARQIKLGVVQAAGSLQDAVARAQQADAAVGFYQATVQSERQQFQAGEATLIDTVLTQQQEIDARLTQVTARQTLAELIAQLRFQTGTMVVNGLTPLPNLITIPQAGAGRQP